MGYITSPVKSVLKLRFRSQHKSMQVFYLMVYGAHGDSCLLVVSS